MSESRLAEIKSREAKAYIGCSEEAMPDMKWLIAELERERTIAVRNACDLKQAQADRDSLQATVERMRTALEDVVRACEVYPCTVKEALSEGEGKR